LEALVQKERIFKTVEDAALENEDMKILRKGRMTTGLSQY
jgi:hypothetical protein